MRIRFPIVSWCIMLFLLIGCTAESSEPEQINDPLPTPTTFSFFEPEDAQSDTVGLTQNTAAVPTVASLFGPQESPTPRPLPTSFPTLPPFRPAITRSQGITATIFTDDLNADWEIVPYPGAVIDTSSQLRTYEGEKSIAFTPEADFTQLFFALKLDAETAYRAEDVLGVSFWLNGGDDFIPLDQMALAVIGSNAYSYWNEDDNSVDLPLGETFSETRLYFLDLNRSIPPNTWVEVYLPLDTLIYDPEYRYVVGFYLKNDEGFRNTVYVDNVSLLLVEGTEEQALASEESSPVIATATVEPTPTSEDEPIEAPTETETPTVTATPESSECVVTPLEGWELYTVQAGETMSDLAIARGISIDFALSTNCLDINDILSVGRQIWLPPLPPAEDAPSAEEPPPAE